jgi:hypothetical protein
MNAPRRLSTLDYLVEVAKDWALSRFAAAESSDFALASHRFELDGHTVRRSPVPRRSREAANPLQSVGRSAHPIAWARSDVATFLADTESGTLEFEQEIVEILGAEGDDVLAAAAHVVRIPGFPPCLGGFFAPT